MLRALAKMGLTDQARLLRISQAWRHAVGPEIAARSEPLSFRRGVLVVKMANAAWQNEMTFLKADLLARLNAALGGETVRDIKVTSGAVTPPTVPEPESVGEPPTPEDQAVAQDAGLAIPDQEVRAVFEKMLLSARRAARGRKPTL